MHRQAERPSQPTGVRTTVAAIMTVRNRRECTLAAVASVLREASDEGVEVSVVVVDDGSTDGTGAAVADLDPVRVQVVPGTGDLYWAAGMALAERVARSSSPDYLLWLNDDVTLDPGFLAVLLDVSRRNDTAVAVGATREPTGRAASYSGLRRAGRHPLHFDVVPPSGLDEDVEAFNGNVVLVPRAVCDAVGGIDGAFAHAYADIDYGLRVRAAHYRSVLVGRPLGTCARNSSTGTWTDRALPVRKRLALLHGPKGAPPRSGVRFLRRHAGPFWPIFLATPYVRIAGEAVLRPLLRERS